MEIAASAGSTTTWLAAGPQTKSASHTAKGAAIMPRKEAPAIVSVWGFFSTMRATTLAAGKQRANTSATRTNIAFRGTWIAANRTNMTSTAVTVAEALKSP